MQQLTAADAMWGSKTYIQWWAVSVDRYLSSNSLSGSLPTELGLLTSLAVMCAHHAMA